MKLITTTVMFFLGLSVPASALEHQALPDRNGAAILEQIQAPSPPEICTTDDGGTKLFFPDGTVIEIHKKQRKELPSDIHIGNPITIQIQLFGD